MKQNKVRFPLSFPELETERLFLKKIRLSDAYDLHTYLSDAEVRKYMGISPYTKIEETYKEIEWYNKIYRTKTGIRWGIALKGDPTIIGSCGFLSMNQAHFRAEIGYELHKDFWRRGIVSEAMAAIVQYGFEKMKVNRIEALVEPENTASLLLLESFNFTREGLLREYEYGAGKFDDLYMYALLMRDYKNFI